MKKKIAGAGAAGALALAAFAGTAAADPGNSGHAPDCARGQATAALAQFEGFEGVTNGERPFGQVFGQFVTHGVYALACQVNIPPGVVN